MHTYTGQCHCGAVKYRGTGFAEIWYCHCRQCRSLTGHFLATTSVPRDAVTMTGELRWTAVSARASHGFCAVCSSPMVWNNSEDQTISVLAGSLDDSTGLDPAGHLFVGEKGAYYAITDGLPQYARWPE